MQAECAAAASAPTDAPDTGVGENSAVIAIAAAAAVAVLVIAVTVAYVCTKRSGTEVHQRAQAAVHANNPEFNNVPFYEEMQPRAIADPTTGAAYANVEAALGHINDAGYAVPETEYSHA